MTQLIEKLTKTGVVPVIKLQNAEDALPLAEALQKGGLPCAEITFRSDAAVDAIKLIARDYPDFLLIAGTVLTNKQADAAIQAGASAIVSPGLNPTVVTHCLDRGYPVIPGVCTPTEVEAALTLGLSHVKFFPAEAAGGVKMIKAMSAPYQHVRFMPTGGISPANLADYLALKAVFACGGSWMVTEDLLNRRAFDEISALAAQAVSNVKEIRA